MTLHVGMVAPEREIWSGAARIVVATTLDGEIGILPGHTPVLGILAEGSVVTATAQDGERVVAAVRGGFLAFDRDQVSILAQEAELGHEVDAQAVRADLERALESLEPGEEESVVVKYARARLRAAGQTV